MNETEVVYHRQMVRKDRPNGRSLSPMKNERTKSPSKMRNIRKNSPIKKKKVIVSYQMGKKDNHLVLGQDTIESKASHHPMTPKSIVILQSKSEIKERRKAAAAIGDKIKNKKSFDIVKKLTKSKNGKEKKMRDQELYESDKENNHSKTPKSQNTKPNIPGKNYFGSGKRDKTKTTKNNKSANERQLKRESRTEEYQTLGESPSALLSKSTLSPKPVKLRNKILNNRNHISFSSSMVPLPGYNKSANNRNQMKKSEKKDNSNHQNKSNLSKKIERNRGKETTDDDLKSRILESDTFSVEVSLCENSITVNNKDNATKSDEIEEKSNGVLSNDSKTALHSTVIFTDAQCLDTSDHIIDHIPTYETVIANTKSDDTIKCPPSNEDFKDEENDFCESTTIKKNDNEDAKQRKTQNLSLASFATVFNFLKGGKGMEHTTKKSKMKGKEGMTPMNIEDDAKTKTLNPSSSKVINNTEAQQNLDSCDSYIPVVFRSRTIQDSITGLYSQLSPDKCQGKSLNTADDEQQSTAKKTCSKNSDQDHTTRELKTSASSNCSCSCCRVNNYQSSSASSNIRNALERTGMNHCSSQANKSKLKNKSMNKSKETTCKETREKTMQSNVHNDDKQNIVEGSKTKNSKLMKTPNESSQDDHKSANKEESFKCLRNDGFAIDGSLCGEAISFGSGPQKQQKSKESYSSQSKSSTSSDSSKSMVTSIYVPEGVTSEEDLDISSASSRSASDKTSQTSKSSRIVDSMYSKDPTMYSFSTESSSVKSSVAAHQTNRIQRKSGESQKKISFYDETIKEDPIVDSIISASHTQDTTIKSVYPPHYLFNEDQESVTNQSNKNLDETNSKSYSEDCITSTTPDGVPTTATVPVPSYKTRKSRAPRGIGIPLDSIHSSVATVKMATTKKTKGADVRSGGIWSNDSHPSTDSYENYLGRMDSILSSSSTRSKSNENIFCANYSSKSDSFYS